MKSSSKQQSQSQGQKDVDNYAKLPGKSQSTNPLNIDYSSMAEAIQKISHSISFENLKKFYRL